MANTSHGWVAVLEARKPDESDEDYAKKVEIYRAVVTENEQKAAAQREKALGKSYPTRR